MRDGDGRFGLLKVAGYLLLTVSGECFVCHY